MLRGAMNAGQSVPFLGGQTVQHFQGCQMTVAPYPVADDNHQKTVPMMQTQPNSSFRLVSMVWVLTSL